MSGMSSRNGKPRKTGRNLQRGMPQEAPLWSEDRDWLVAIVMVPDDELEENRRLELDWLGRVFAYSQVTNSRMLAQVGDPDVTAYEIWVSFDSAEHKRKFMALVGDDEATDSGDPCNFSPSVDFNDIWNLRPLGEVLPQEYADHVSAPPAAILVSEESGPVN
jgi:hypothetical protein